MKSIHGLHIMVRTFTRMLLQYSLTGSQEEMKIRLLQITEGEKDKMEREKKEETTRKRRNRSVGI